MEAHAGSITIRAGRATRPRRRRFADLVTAIRAARLERARRAHSLRTRGRQAYSVPGSEHTHLIHRPRGF